MHSLSPPIEPEKPTDLKLFEVRYRVSEHFGSEYETDPVDLHEILKTIRQGKKNSDLLITSIHAHERGNWSNEPADFLRVLAHAAIDHGVDIFIGHGLHRLRGIEIYKGKPIFCSLGNFFFQLDLEEPTCGKGSRLIRQQLRMQSLGNGAGSACSKKMSITRV